ncbi:MULTISPECIES: class I SAM-dependent methyltransferase [unclassified Mesorhizobium]|uniref:class I SAM-dependent methyltransferase n=1 Tax=unclassified Mesorhizobium TaxID=325217 RepID=UPI000FDA9CBB|nr:MULTISPECIES: class I SAM-dependent methyltransferase [unclassified Mesorhizobium]TGR41167.1 class I SAM-dependent methyltransferase [bacterium M00.F.Ca.ET.199.01.1.1]TGU32098.1 class I SAM-dependent methyltransferase [bacterium M00.F.Ca.ET.156.01.1.1]TGV86102.1 class I SAM-dependent methyltransferase [Mesorhizobium sp. M00.F.Ca.ET.149.01.1.1]TGR25892.1 class I SAM-dependent methyltransferase [Mesorhizobium sp. M8A.F.Ca.ET.197.01.1.1]TGR26342.1 class I SAM-dependent methyltransferase [Mesor
MSTTELPASPEFKANHAELMDGVYRWQRHIYDLTRKYYLLGRDKLISGLDVPVGGTVLELGCGTGRNIILAARAYPDARFFGLDISAEMLETAGKAIDREGLSDRVMLARGDATDFDAKALFGKGSFDRVFVSYSLSMIPGWEKTVSAALAALAPTGSLHIVDFGHQEGLPGWFRALLRGWLKKFHVTPRESLRDVLESQAERTGATFRFRTLYRGYAWLAVIGPHS